MWKYTVEVNGMMCGMCEAHVNDAVRKACPVKKVNSSRSKNQTVILSETDLDTEALMNAIRSTGYEVGTIQKEPYKKRGLFGLILSHTHAKACRMIALLKSRSFLAPYMFKFIPVKQKGHRQIGNSIQNSS